MYPRSLPTEDLFERFAFCSLISNLKLLLLTLFYMLE
jgi:hypothetical protein